MTADDKLGFGAGLLALGLAGGLILLAQVLPKDFAFHREPILAEQIFDGLLCLAGIPAGLWLLVKGSR